MLIGTVDRDEEENDENENAAISIDVCYFIVGGNDASKTFDLHPLRHEIIAVRELDRELRSEYVLVVKATEQCIPDNDQDEAIEFDPTDDSLLQVKIKRECSIPCIFFKLSTLLWNCFLRWDHWKGDMMPLLDAALLCSSRVDADLVFESGLV